MVARMRLPHICSLPFVLKRKLSSMRISEIFESKPIGCEVEVKGWVKTIRWMKKLTFFDVVDGSTFKVLQIVIDKNSLNEELSYGSSVAVCGKVALTPSGQIELHSDRLKVIGCCNVNDGYPFLPRKIYEPQELREHLHFRSRTTTFSSMLRVRNRASRCIREFFEKEKFVDIHTPVLTSNDCEGAGEIFLTVPESEAVINETRKEGKTATEAFFDQNVFLTVSAQLHLEVMARTLGNVYHFGPVFRAENSKSRLHLSEFYMIEAEIAFLENLKDLLQLMENLIKYTTVEVLKTHEEEIRNYRKLKSLPDLNLDNIIEKPYAVMNFDDALDILNRTENHIGENKHLSKENELFLVRYNNNVPVFIVNWPSKIKPFYVKTDSTTSKAEAVDLLFPDVGELCGGSLRETDYNLLKEKLIECELTEKLDWYLDLRKFGNVPTGGFGMGFERFLKVLMGTANIKDTIPFPRWPHNCKL